MYSVKMKMSWIMAACGVATAALVAAAVSWAAPVLADARKPRPGKAGLAPAVYPRVVVSLSGCTLRLETAAGKRRVFPVGVGRLTDSGQEGPLGTLRTGPDPRDRDLYLPRRRLPAFHRGLPFLRLDRRRARGKVRPFGIHGPVSPTLIWGRVSRGCIRMRPADIRLLYGVAVRHPSMPVTFIRGLDRVGARPVKPDRKRPPIKGCPEAAVGARRLRRLATGGQVHDRVCGGVDHWYAVPMEGGDVTSVKLQHAGGLRVELFGIKAISAIASGERGFVFRLPLAHRNRGDRFVRVMAPAGARNRKRFLPYTLSVTMSGSTTK